MYIPLLVEQGLNCLPVVAYEESPNTDQDSEHEARTFLVGLLTRSDLLIELARTLGAFEPGINLLLPIPTNDLTAVAKMLQVAAELHIKVGSVIIAPPKKGVTRAATVHISTINPAPLLIRLQQDGIAHSFADFQMEEDPHARQT
jgi:acetoin utilization protein AcuB